mgnify:CR=1 FL=1
MIKRALSAGLVLAIFALSIPPVSSCTRAVYKGPGGLVITARSMDWKDEIPGNMWLFPRGMERHGVTGPNTVTWKSKYGSVVTSSFDIASVDGMNEKGLVGNMLWLAESTYPEFDGSQKGLSVSAWLQYALDNFATVAEAVEALAPEPFVVVTDVIPGTEKMTTVHLSLSDASGDNAIFEYIEGKLVIHHDPSYVVMTNNPTYEKQLAIMEYWKQIGGLAMLPGTNKAADRFVRASFYLEALPQTTDYRTAVSSVFSLIRNTSVPLGIASEDQPNISSTRWRTVADQKNLVYYFESTLAPNVFWVDLKKLDFSEGAQVKKLEVGNFPTHSGETSALFKETPPFEFVGL